MGEQRNAIFVQTPDIYDVICHPHETCCEATCQYQVSQNV